MTSKFSFLLFLHLEEGIYYVDLIEPHDFNIKIAIARTSNIYEAYGYATKIIKRLPATYWLVQRQVMSGSTDVKWIITSTVQLVTELDQKIGIKL